jgi:hypothetical protein
MVPRAHLFEVFLELRALIRREHVHDLLAHRFPGLRIARTPLRMRGAVSAEDLADLSTLLVAETEVAECAHPRAVMRVIGRSAFRLSRRLLGVYGSRQDASNQERSAEDESWDFVHALTLPLRSKR